VIAACVAALVGFAANSLLCRAALGNGAIDAASFTAIRIGSGAVVLLALSRGARGHGSWASALALFAYAAAFSFAYLELTTATGALVLFATVQATMIGVGISRGDRPRALQWLGIAIAIAGLIALLAPGLAAPDPIGAALMAAAGVAWGVYSIRGRTATHALAATAGNFARAVPFAALLLLWVPVRGGHVTLEGALLAAASGAIASGLGYSLWYTALPHLPGTRAAIVQLSVPVLATLGGVVVLDEALSLQLAIATAAIVGGILLALLSRSGARPRT
jgi:drug/metabolite transporter (DMT)-like permease